MEIIVTKENFEQEVLNNPLPVLVDFWASWCGPCRMLMPTLETLSKELAGKAVIAKINVDEQPELAARFGVMSIPTLLVFRGGQVVESAVGVQPKGKLLAMLGI